MFITMLIKFQPTVNFHIIMLQTMIGRGFGRSMTEFYDPLWHDLYCLSYYEEKTKDWDSDLLFRSPPRMALH